MAGLREDGGDNLLRASEWNLDAKSDDPRGAEGLEALKVAAGKLPRDREIILYCGCCPWSNCPNVKPAVELLKQMGFTRVKAMFVETNFAKDWIDKGYPVEAGTARQ